MDVSWLAIEVGGGGDGGEWCSPEDGRTRRPGGRAKRGIGLTVIAVEAVTGDITSFSHFAESNNLSTPKDNF